MKAGKEFLWYAKEEKCQEIRFELRQEEKFQLLLSRAQEKNVTPASPTKYWAQSAIR